MSLEGEAAGLSAAPTTEAMAALTSEAAWLQAMLDVEAALVLVEADLDLVPAEAAERIARCCSASHFDPAGLRAATLQAGSPVIPLVAALRAAAGSAGEYAHFGATSQDVIDTALMLLLRGAVSSISTDLHRMAAAAASLASEHRTTLMVGRTLLQQALPTTFGLKAAGWLNAVLDSLEALERMSRERLAVQFGGAVGTLASLGDSGPLVAAALAARLGLLMPVAPWHSDRSRLVEVASAVTVAAAVAGKVALDLALLMQTEVGEVLEPAAPHRGTSSAMPQKHNPSLSAAALASSRRAATMFPVLLGCMIQEHERGLSALHEERPALNDLLRATAFAVRTAAEILEGLRVDSDQMLATLSASRGLVMAERVAGELGRLIGRSEARALVEEACQAVVASRSTTLADEVGARLPAATQLSKGDIESWLDPRTYLGSADWFIERVLARYAGASEGSLP